MRADDRPHPKLYAYIIFPLLAGIVFFGLWLWVQYIPEDFDKPIKGLSALIVAAFTLFGFKWGGRDLEISARLRLHHPVTVVAMAAALGAIVWTIWVERRHHIEIEGIPGTAIFIGSEYMRKIPTPAPEKGKESHPSPLSPQSVRVPVRWGKQTIVLKGEQLWGAPREEYFRTLTPAVFGGGKSRKKIVSRPAVPRLAAYFGEGLAPRPEFDAAGTVAETMNARWAELLGGSLRADAAIKALFTVTGAASGEKGAVAILFPQEHVEKLELSGIGKAAPAVRAMLTRLYDRIYRQVQDEDVSEAIRNALQSDSEVLVANLAQAIEKTSVAATAAARTPEPIPTPIAKLLAPAPPKADFLDNRLAPILGSHAKRNFASASHRPASVDMHTDPAPKTADEPPQPRAAASPEPRGERPVDPPPDAHADAEIQVIPLIARQTDWGGVSKKVVGALEQGFDGKGVKVQHAQDVSTDAFVPTGVEVRYFDERVECVHTSQMLAKLLATLLADANDVRAVYAPPSASFLGSVARPKAYFEIWVGPGTKFRAE